MGRTLTLVLVASTIGCGFERRLDYVPVRSEIMRADLSYSVYLPPDYQEGERLPMIVFLHGGGDDPAVWDRYGLSETFDRMHRSGELPRALVFFPQGDNGFWMNWYDGTRRYEDWVVDELMPEVASRYDTLPCPEHCHVMGVSMGAHGALRFALHRPERFASVTALSGPIFDTEQMMSFTQNRLYSTFIPTHRIFGPPSPRSRIEAEDIFLRWDDPDDVEVDIFFGWATDDRGQIKLLNERFHQHLEERGIPHHAEEFEGGHNWYTWEPVIARAMRYHLETDG